LFKHSAGDFEGTREAAMIPINCLSRQEAIEVIAAAKFAGVPDRGAVIEARQKGVDAADGPANDEAISELWRAVDQGTLEVIAHGPGDRWLKMSPEETKRPSTGAGAQRLPGPVSDQQDGGNAGFYPESL
jgi:hypothetical protein